MFQIQLSPKHLPMVLIYISLRMNDAEHLLMYPLAVGYFLVNFPKSRVSSLEIVSGPPPPQPGLNTATLIGISPILHVLSLPAFPRHPALINFLVGMDSGACLLNAGWKSFARAVILTHTELLVCFALHMGPV